MARISNKKWCEYTEIKHTARGSVEQMSCDDIKLSAYEALFEVSNSWGSTFGANLREAVYCGWWKVARQMLGIKTDCKSKERALTIIADLEHMSKGGDK
jgi:hypothetical protein